MTDTLKKIWNSKNGNFIFFLFCVTLSGVFLYFDRPNVTHQNDLIEINGTCKHISQELGQATAKLFHLGGAIVIVSDIRDEEGNALVKNLKTNAEYLHLDVGNEESWLKATEYMTTKYGRLDILVSNGG